MGSLLVVVFPSRKKCLGGIFIILIGVLKDPKMKSESFYPGYGGTCHDFILYPIPSGATKLRILHIVTYIHFYI